MSKKDLFAEDAGVDEQFHYSPYNRQLQYYDEIANPHFDSEKAYVFEDRKQPEVYIQKVRNGRVYIQREYNSEDKTVKARDPHKGKVKYTCGLEKCRICKKIKPATQRRNAEFLVRKRYKAPLPPLPVLNSKKKQNQKQLKVFFESEGDAYNRRRRKVKSMVDNPQSEDYDQILPRTKTYNSRVIEDKKKYETQPDQASPKFIRMRGKLYQVVEQNPNEKKIENSTHKKISSVRNLIHPIMDVDNWKDYKNEEQRKRQQTSEIVDKYINLSTMFQLTSKGEVPIPQPMTKSSLNQQKVSLYRLKSDQNYTNQSNEDMFKTFYQRHQGTNLKGEVQQQNQQYEQKQIYNIKFPTLGEIEQSIDAYKSLTGKLQIDVLKNSGNYSREYSDEPGHEFLYFGGFDHAKKQRKGLGVYVSKKMILQGIWMSNQILKGSELRTNSLYEGDFKKNKKHGEGVCKWLNGEQYMGQWENGLRNGHGFWSAKRGRETYSGEWKNGKVFGYGEYLKKNYSQFKGYFQNFVKNGAGVQNFTNGDKFEGTYKNGVPEGKGIYTWECGLRYEGQFQKGERSGKGQLKMSGVFQIIGDFEKDRPHGICQLKTRNNDIFIGKFVYGKKYGFGKIQQGIDGYVQEGFWNDQVLKQRLDDEREQKRQVFYF